MSNLYDKLKTEFKDQLEESCVKYSTAQRLKYVLLSKSFWGDITIDDMKSLLTYTDACGYEMSASDFMYGKKFFEDNE